MKSIWILLALSTVTFSLNAQAADTIERLVSPYLVKEARAQLAVTAKEPSTNCTALVPPVSSFVMESRYDKSDSTASTVDPAAEAAYNAAVAPIQTFGSRVGKAGDAYALSKSANKAVAACALNHLYSWANANALLGELNNVGFLVTSTAVSSAAAAYLKISSAYPSKTATADELAKLKRIRTWLRDQGLNLAQHFETVVGKTGVNNQRYTSGMAIGLTAIATQNYDLFAAAMRSLRVGLNEIQPDGYLPLELARGTRALSYHFVAVAPLVLLMEMAVINNEPSITIKDRQKLSKLVNFIYKSYKDPSLMLTYAPSLPTQEQGFACNDFAFLEVHLATAAKVDTPNATLLSFVKKQRASCGDLYVSSLGGDMTYLFGL
jgi:poly(beta-D-mannuronate) lyase